jgi:hypothetical protein
MIWRMKIRQITVLKEWVVKREISSLVSQLGGFQMIFLKSVGYAKITSTCLEENTIAEIVESKLIHWL